MMIFLSAVYFFDMVIATQGEEDQKPGKDQKNGLDKEGRFSRNDNGAQSKDDRDGKLDGLIDQRVQNGWKMEKIVVRDRGLFYQNALEK